MKEKTLFTGLMFVFLVLVFLVQSVYAVPSCAFGGSVTDINEDPVAGTEVKAYLQETGELVKTGMNTASGYGIAIEDADGKNIIFMVSNKIADQGPQYCSGLGLFTLLDLSVTDSDDDDYGQGEDCDDADAGIHPPEEICDDGLDNDCDGFIDEADPDCWDKDNDGYCGLNYESCLTNPGEFDCKDNDAAINPGVAEICDGEDNDCNGAIDEGGVCPTPPGGGGGGGGGVDLSKDWECGEWSECVDGTQTQECNHKWTSATKTNTQSCFEEETGPCVENWNCREWSECSAEGTRECTGGFVDANNCGTEENLPSSVVSCTPPSIEIAEEEALPSPEEEAEVPEITGAVVGLGTTASWIFLGILVALIAALLLLFLLRRRKKKH